VTSTNPQTKFQLQFWKQQEDSTIILASNRPRQEGQDKKNSQKGKRKTKGKGNKEKL
jgi:hypothetical protein